MMSGKFFIKGIIHITYIKDKEIDFEVIEEHFFHAELEKNGHFLDQSDMDIGLEYELRQMDWDIKPKEAECYGVLWQFEVGHTSYWTDCGMEYDMDIETINLDFSLIDEENTGWILGDIVSKENSKVSHE